MVTWLNDENALQVYDGTAWNGLAASGGNAVINGAFEINQRGFTSSTANTFGFDRWDNLTAGNGTSTFSSQAFTPGSAPVAGYESSNYLRMVSSGQSATNSRTSVRHPIEDVRTFAGQTATLSFFARSGSATPKLALELFQEFGSGGSSIVFVTPQQVTISTSWTRYSLTFAVPSISGKTIGTSSSLGLSIFASAGSDFNSRTDSLGIQSNTFDIWGVQLEAGPTANVFRRNANSRQGELAACQRYFQAIEPEVLIGTASATSAGLLSGSLPTTMRAASTVLLSTGSSIDINFFGVGSSSSSTFVLTGRPNSVSLNISALSPTRTQFNPIQATSPSFLFLSSEL